MIDGVNISNTGYGALGSYCIVFASLGSGVPFVRPGMRYEQQQLIGTWRPSRGTDTGGYTEVQFHVPNPAFGRVIAYQASREVRIGARVRW